MYIEESKNKNFLLFLVISIFKYFIFVQSWIQIMCVHTFMCVYIYLLWCTKFKKQDRNGTVCNWDINYWCFQKSVCKAKEKRKQKENTGHNLTFKLILECKKYLCLTVMHLNTLHWFFFLKIIWIFLFFKN